MTLTIEAASAPVDDHGERPVAPGQRVDAAHRGRTTVAPHAVEKIVGRVAVETPGVAAAEPVGIRGWFASSGASGADVDVEGRRDGLHIQLALAIAYPRPVAEVVREVRRRVISHLDERLDLHVGALDIRVTELRRTRPPITIRRRVR
jgi:uncharacterized alkaline shock family protein YloU